jgi:hypothetical protein
LGIDATTLEIRAIEVTDNAIGDAPMLPCLLDKIAKDDGGATTFADVRKSGEVCIEVPPSVAERAGPAIEAWGRACPITKGQGGDKGAFTRKRYWADVEDETGGESK